MATINYQCSECNKEFEVWYRSLTECKDKDTAICPKCDMETGYKIMGTPSIHYKTNLKTGEKG